MARFNLVYVYPPTGFPERLQNVGESTPLQDAFIRSSRSVTWLYTEALKDIEVHGDRAELRIFIRDVRSEEGVDLHVWPGRPHDLPGEFAFVSIPEGAEDLDAAGRAHLMLGAVHAAVLRVAELRGWEPTQFEACRRHVLDHDFVYRWTSAWKSAPDRRHRARASYVLGPVDGFGRARLEIATRDSDGPIARSAEAIASSTRPGFERSARTLRWDGKSEVAMRPFGSSRNGSGQIIGRHGEGGWTFDVTDELTVRRPTPRMDLADVPDEEKQEKLS